MRSGPGEKRLRTIRFGGEFLGPTTCPDQDTGWDRRVSGNLQRAKLSELRQAHRSSKQHEVRCFTDRTYGISMKEVAKRISPTCRKEKEELVWELPTFSASVNAAWEIGEL